MILSQALSTVASRASAQPAIHFLEKETNYTELKTRVARLSYLFLHDFGGKPQRVAFYCSNSPSVVATFFALTNTRSVSILLDPERTYDELAEWLKESKATHLAVTSDLVSKARDLLQTAHLHLPIIEIEKKHGGEYDTSFTAPQDNAPIDTDPVILVRTSGSAGKPKLISLNHKQLHHAATCLRSPYHLSPTDRVLTRMSWSHPYAFVHGMLLPILNGAVCVVDHGLPMNHEFLEFLKKSRTSRIVGAPPFFHSLLVACRDAKQGLPGMRSVTIGLGSLGPELRKAFALLKVPACHTHGQAENVWTTAMEDVEELIAMKPDDAAAKPRGTSGRALAGLKYKVIDENGDEVAKKGQREGQLAVMGPTVMTGYVDREKETKSAIRGTWLYTGDLAQLDGDGDEVRVTFLGKKDDAIHKGGRYVFPDSIDAALRGMPGVQDAAGFVMRNSKGEGILACAVVKAQGNPLTEKQVIEHCSSKLRAEEAPVVAVFTDFIPRDVGGNINRARLRSQFSGIAG